MYAVRERNCASCLEPVKGRIPPTGDVYCVMCNVGKAAEAAIQMANKSGPYYDQWLKTRGPQGRPRTK